MKANFDITPELLDTMYPYIQDIEQVIYTMGLKYDRKDDMYAIKQNDLIVLFANPMVKMSMFPDRYLIYLDNDRLIILADYVIRIINDSGKLMAKNHEAASILKAWHSEYLHARNKGIADMVIKTIPS